VVASRRGLRAPGPTIRPLPLPLPLPLCASAVRGPRRVSWLELLSCCRAWAACVLSVLYLITTEARRRLAVAKLRPTDTGAGGSGTAYGPAGSPPIEVPVQLARPGGAEPICGLGQQRGVDGGRIHLSE
jgi:hypothetical protein